MTIETRIPVGDCYPECCDPGDNICITESTPSGFYSCSLTANPSGWYPHFLITGFEDEAGLGEECGCPGKALNDIDLKGDHVAEIYPCPGYSATRYICEDDSCNFSDGGEVDGSPNCPLGSSHTHTLDSLAWSVSEVAGDFIITCNVELDNAAAYSGTHNLGPGPHCLEDMLGIPIELTSMNGGDSNCGDTIIVTLVEFEPV